jgi:hypothetical protein
VLSHLKNLVKNLAEADNVGPIAACTLIKCGDTSDLTKFSNVCQLD